MSELNEDVNIKITWKGQEHLLAIANISFETVIFGTITIKGFQIWASDHQNQRLQEFINITPPTIMVYGRRLKIAFFEDDECWSQIEMKIYDKFCLKRGEMDEKKINADLDLEDVPF